MVINVRQHIFNWLNEVYDFSEPVTNEKMLKAIKKMGTPEEMAFMVLDDDDDKFSPPTIETTRETAKEVTSPAMSSSIIVGTTNASGTPSRATMRPSRYDANPPLIDLKFSLSFRFRNLFIIRWTILLALAILVMVSIADSINQHCVFNADCTPTGISSYSYFLNIDADKYFRSKEIAILFFVLVFIYSIWVLIIRSILYKKSLNNERLISYDEKIFHVILVMYLSWMIYTVNDYMIYSVRNEDHDLYSIHENLTAWFKVQALLWVLLILTDRWVIKYIIKFVKSIKTRTNLMN